MTYSVLMSVYQGDQPSYLAEALHSIYDGQTKRPDEIVIVCDGPLTSELYAVVDEFKRGKEDIVCICPLTENQGLGAALRTGVEHCTGDCIFRMDADDISDSRRFELQSAYMEAHPEIDVLGTDIAEFKASLNEHMRVRTCPADHETICRMGKTRNPMNHVSVCMKREAVLKAGNYETLLLLEDYYLWLKMMAAGCRLVNLNETLVYVRIGRTFEQKRGAKERLHGWQVLQDFMLEHGMISRGKAKRNMLAIKAFVHTPPFLKSLIYKTILRK